MNRRIDYTIGFKSDANGLNTLKTQLHELQNITRGELRLVNPEKTKAELDSIMMNVRQSAQNMQTALTNSFNPKLNTTSIVKFNAELNKIPGGLAGIQQGFAQAGAKGRAAFNMMTAQVLTTQKAVRQTSPLLKSMANTFFNTLKWSVASAAITGVTSAIRNAFNYTKQLDTSLNNIRIVTGESQENMEKFAKSANKAAKSLGAATTAYTDAALIYYQQGLGEKDVMARAEVTIKAANVTGQSAQEVSEQLTAVWNGYRVAADEAELYIDKLANVAATTASNLQELSEGMSKVASSANAMGIDIDQLTASLSTVISATRQDASSVGTAFKTIFARMGDLQVDGVDEFGVKLGDVSGKMRQMGIEVLDETGNLRDMGEVIEEVASKWGTWTQAQQQAAAVALAGKRQYNNLIALFENWDKYESAKATSQGAEGTLQKQQDTYMESTAAKIQQLSAAGERVKASLFDSESTKDLIEALTKITDLFGGFIESIGGGGTLLLSLGAIAMQVFGGQMAMGITRVVTNFGKLKENQTEYQAQLKLSAQYENVSGEALEKMVNLKKLELKYGEMLTDEQKEQINNLIQLTAQEDSNLALQEESLAKAREYIKTRFGAEIDNSGTGNLLAGGVQPGQTTTDENAAVLLRRNLEDVTNGEKALGTVGQLAQSYNKANINATNFSSTQEKLANQILETSEQTELLTQTNILSESETEELIEAQRTLEVIFDKVAKKEKLTEDDMKDLAVAQNTVRSSTQKVKNELGKMANDLDTTPKKIEATSGSIKKIDADIKNLDSTIKTAAIIKNILSGVSALGSLASAASMVLNVRNIWDNESLSDAEKLTQTISMLASFITMLAFGAGALRSSLLGITEAMGLQNTAFSVSLALSAAKNEEDKKSILISYAKAKGISLEGIETEKLSFKQLAGIVAEKGMTEAKKKGTKATIAQTIANWAMQASMWYILVIVIAIVASMVALVGIITVLTNAFKNISDNGKKAFEEASKAATKASEAFDETKQSVEDLKNAFNEYDKIQETIQGLTRDTEEWNEAVQKSNEQVLDLLGKYPELAEYISDVNGMLTISKKGEEEILAKALSGQARTYENLLESQSAVRRAENNMIRQQMEADILKTDDLAKMQLITHIAGGLAAPLAASIGSTLFAGIGTASAGASAAGFLGAGTAGMAGSALAGGAASALLPFIGPLIAALPIVLGAISAMETQNEIERRERGMSELVDAITSEGTSFLGSQALFNKELVESRGVSQQVADELWKNREEIIKNSAELIANTKAIEAQQIQSAKSYLQDKSIIYKDSQNQDALAKIFAQQTNMETDAFLKEREAITGTDWKTINKAEGEAMKKEYAEIVGISYESAVVNDDDDTVTYTMADGTERTIDAATLANTIASNRVKEKFDQEQLKDIENALNNLSTRLGDTGKALTTAVAGKNANFDTLSNDEFNSFRNEIENKSSSEILSYLGLTEYQIRQLGYKNAEEYVKALQSGIDNYELRLDYLFVGKSSFTRDAYQKIEEEITSKLTLAAKEGIANAIEQGLNSAGPRAAEALSSFYNTIGGSLSDEEIQQLNSAISSIDWSSSNAINEFKIALKEIGLEGKISEESLIDLTEAAENFKNVGYEILNNFSEITNKIKELKDLTKNLSIGNIIEDESYNKLVAYNKELEKFFVLTAEGYKYLGGGENAISAALNNVVDFSKGKVQVQNMIEEVGAENFVFDDKAYTTDTKLTAISDLFKSGLGANLLTNSKIDYTEFMSALTLGSSSASSIHSSLSGYTVGNLANMKAEDLANQLGIKIETAQAYIDEAKNRIEQRNTKVNTWYSNILGNIAGVENGAAAEQILNSSLLYVSSQAKDYEEFKQLQYFIEDEEQRRKLGQSYLNDEAKTLGLNEEMWLALTEDEAYKNNLNAQDEYLDNVRKLQVYKETDYFKDVAAAIDEVTKSLESLSEEQDHLIGQHLLDNLKEQVDLQTILLEKEEEKLEKQREQWELNQLVLNGNNFKLKELGLSDISYNEDGSVSDATYKAIVNKLMSGDLSDSERTFLMTLLGDIDKFNKDIEEGNQAYLDAIVKRSQETSKLLQTEFDTKLQITLDLSTARADWIKFENEMLDFSFGEKTSQEMLTQATTLFDKYKEGLFEGENSLLNLLDSSFEDMYAIVNTNGQRLIEQANRLEAAVIFNKEAWEEAKDTTAEKTSEYISAVNQANENNKQVTEEVNKLLPTLEEKRKINDQANADLENWKKTGMEKSKAEALRLFTKEDGEYQQSYFDIDGNTISTLQDLINNTGKLKNHKFISSYFDQIQAPASNYGGGLSGTVQEIKTKNLRTLDEFLQSVYQTKQDVKTAIGKQSGTELLDEKNLERIIMNYIEEDFTMSQNLANEYARRKYNTELIRLQNAVNATETAVTNIETDIENIQKDTQVADNSAVTEAQDNEAAAESGYKTSINNLYTGVANIIEQFGDNKYVSQNKDGTIRIDEAAWNEDVLNLIEESKTGLEEMKAQYEQIYQAYLKSQEEIMAVYQDQIDMLSTINGMTKSQLELWKLTSAAAGQSSDKIKEYYGLMTKNSLDSLSHAQNQLTSAQYEYEKIMTYGENATQKQIDTVTENLKTATENVLSMAQEYSTALAEEYGAYLTGVIDDYMKTIAGTDLQGITEQWERELAMDDRYLDDVNAAYAIENIERQYNKSIDETDSLTAQKKLNTVMQEQLKILREKDKLSQYDIDRANAMYELTLKQIALEEAQQTATKMKLTRDASGNYTYQYVQDTDAVAKAEEELAAARNELYNLDKDRNEELVSDYYAMMQEAQEKMKQAVAEGDEARLQELQEYYFGENGLLKGIQNELGIAEDNLTNIGQTLMGTDWSSGFVNFTKAITDSKLDELLGKVSDATNQTAIDLKDMSDIFTNILGEDSGISVAIKTLGETIKGPLDAFNEAMSISNTSTDALINLIELKGPLTDLTEKLGQYVEAYNDYMTNLNAEELRLNTTALGDSTKALQESAAATRALIDELGTKVPEGFDYSNDNNSDGEASQI